MENKTIQRSDVRNVFLAWLITIIVFEILLIANIVFKISIKPQSATILSSILITDILLGVFFFILGVIFSVWMKVKASYKKNHKIILEDKNRLPRYNVVWLFAIIAVFILSGNLVNDYVSIHAKPLPTYYPTDTPTIFLQPTYKNVVVPATPTSEPWGVAIQKGPNSYRININQDSTMAAPNDVFNALNNYRRNNGRSTLNWNSDLASLAQSRADYYVSIGATDKHAGMIKLEESDYFPSRGWKWVGENSSYGYQLIGVHLIEWLFASDPGHNGNQLDSRWTDVGVGVADTATDIIFGERQ